MKKPNVIYIYADDLGKGCLSCYGQKQYQTPNIDRIANTGIKCNRAYGCSICAPARASLLTGYHDCHAGTWSHTLAGIYEKLNTGELDLATIYETVNNSAYQYLDDEQFLPSVFNQAGYVTGQIGKLEWGFATTQQELDAHGWDYHYGYYDHKLCHGFYPPSLFENGEIVPIAGNTHSDCGKTPERESEENRKLRYNMEGRAVYSQDLFNEKIVEFIQKNHDMPFFLFHPSQLPHGPIAVPEIHPGVQDNDALSLYEKEYASMVLRLDDTVGMIYEQLEKYGLLENTIVIFSSDNGHEIYYKEDGRMDPLRNQLDGSKIDEIDNHFTTEAVNDIFNGNAGMRGKKRSSLDGGARLPYVISWPSVIQPNSESDHLFTNYDLLPTVCDMLEISLQKRKDGLSFLPMLEGKAQPAHDFIVYAGNQGPAIVTPDGYKLRFINKDNTFRLYDLNSEEGEAKDLAAQQPERVRTMGMELLKQCHGNFDHGTIFTHRAYYLENFKSRFSE